MNYLDDYLKTYLSDYGYDDPIDNNGDWNDVYIDEETKLGQMFDTYQLLKPQKDTYFSTLQRLLTPYFPRDFICHAFFPFVHEFSFQPLIELSISETVEAFYQPYDFPPCPLERVDTYGQEPLYASYFWDDEVTEQRIFNAKMVYLYCNGYSISHWYKTRRSFYNDHKWTLRQRDVITRWTLFHLLLDHYKEWIHTSWEWELRTLKWTYTINGTPGSYELPVMELFRNAIPFLWFEIPETELKKGPVQLQFQLSNGVDEYACHYKPRTYNEDTVFYTSRIYTISPSDS